MQIGGHFVSITLKPINFQIGKQNFRFICEIGCKKVNFKRNSTEVIWNFYYSLIVIVKICIRDLGYE